MPDHSLKIGFNPNDRFVTLGVQYEGAWAPQPARPEAVDGFMDADQRARPSILEVGACGSADFGHSGVAARTTLTGLMESESGAAAWKLLALIRGRCQPRGLGGGDCQTPRLAVRTPAFEALVEDEV